ncbi:hypothetical protein MJO28_013439, partial [Puccinia striiformis f. sp. tritici]
MYLFFFFLNHKLSKKRKRDKKNKTKINKYWTYFAHCRICFAHCEKQLKNIAAPQCAQVS